MVVVTQQPSITATRKSHKKLSLAIQHNSKSQLQLRSCQSDGVSQQKPQLPEVIELNSFQTDTSNKWDALAQKMLSIELNLKQMGEQFLQLQQTAK